VRTRTVLALLLIALPGACCAQTYHEGFDGPFPPVGWVNGDGLSGEGIVWGTNADWSHGNWTGGDGACAELCSTDDPRNYDAWLRTSPLIVPPGGHLYARVNYQNNDGEDVFRVYMFVAMDNYLLATYPSDIGGFQTPSGQWIDVDLSVFAGMELAVSFRYTATSGDPGNDLYCQIDDVTVGDETAVAPSSWSSIKSLYLR